MISVGDQWHACNRFTRSTRPVRALDRMRRAMLELVGFGKKSTLFEEAFAIRLLRELQPVIQQHPVVTAHRAPFVRPEPIAEAAALALLGAPSAAPAGSRLVLGVQVANVGGTPWNAGERDGEVRLGVQLLAPDGRVIDRDFARHPFAAPVLPGGRCELAVPVTVPSAPGAYVLKLDLVREGVRWFELAGSRPVVHPIEVTE